MQTKMNFLSPFQTGRVAVITTVISPRHVWIAGCVHVPESRDINQSGASSLQTVCDSVNGLESFPSGPRAEGCLFVLRDGIGLPVPKCFVDFAAVNNSSERTAAEPARSHRCFHNVIPASRPAQSSHTHGALRSDSACLGCFLVQGEREPPSSLLLMPSSELEPARKEWKVLIKTSFPVSK